MYVIFQILGIQYFSKKDDLIKINKINLDINQNIEINKIYFLDYNNNIYIGNPFLKNVKIFAKILNHGRDKKIRVVKFKRRKNFIRIKNHRQEFTNIKITDIKLYGS